MSTPTNPANTGHSPNAQHNATGNNTNALGKLLESLKKTTPYETLMFGFYSAAIAGGLYAAGAIGKHFQKETYNNICDYTAVEKDGTEIRHRWDVAKRYSMFNIFRENLEDIVEITKVSPSQREEISISVKSNGTITQYSVDGDTTSIEFLEDGVETLGNINGVKPQNVEKILNSRIKMAEQGYNDISRICMHAKGTYESGRFDELKNGLKTSKQNK